MKYTTSPPDGKSLWSTQVLILLIALPILLLYLALRPGRLPDVIYWGCGLVFIISAVAQLSARLLFHRSIPGLNHAWQALVVAELAFGSGIVLLVIPKLSRWGVPVLLMGFVVYLLWSVLDVVGRRGNADIYVDKGAEGD